MSNAHPPLPPMMLVPSPIRRSTATDRTNGGVPVAAHGMLTDAQWEECLNNGNVTGVGVVQPAANPYVVAGKKRSPKRKSPASSGKAALSRSTAKTANDEEHDDEKDEGDDDHQPAPKKKVKKSASPNNNDADEAPPSPETMAANTKRAKSLIQYQTNRSDTKWKERFALLQAHIDQHGTADLNVIPKDQVNKDLFIFVSEARRHYKKFVRGEKTSLTQAKVDELSATGFDWTPMNSGGYSNGKHIRSQVSWEEQFKALVEYKEEHGDCLVPCVATGGSKLSHWVRTQRKKFNSLGVEKFPKDRFDKLIGIGFDFAPRQSKDYMQNRSERLKSRLDETWSNWFEILKKYKAENGNVLVSSKLEEHRPLVNWLHKQRKEYKKFKDGKSTKMCDEWIAKMTEIGFDFAPMSNSEAYSATILARAGKRSDKIWQGHFEALKKYYVRHGHCYVVRGDDTNSKLASWVHAQRKNKKLFDEGKKSSINEERIKLLNEIGFDFCPSKGEGMTKIRQVKLELEWEHFFQKLVLYKEVHGVDAMPKKKDAETDEVKKLSVWCARQKRLMGKYRKGEEDSLEDWKVAKLEGIGLTSGSESKIRVGCSAIGSFL
ncbi:predicted protein [Thalassiosira pseudonana CCMP1335]|uniref:Helicase-associated domain-containing protein n=1 Tax=Thalassiosira pseudonana TaxID=35128 RepID=B8BW30_THAPS|nr:predicted protein [Thalassiosira pseudonana CCMP1335]EED95564.1 predicted protein [Thalassiosira pseudonana CCMP1335]|eukprot:g9600.t1 g9600   contig4:113504-115312(+)